MMQSARAWRTPLHDMAAIDEESESGESEETKREVRSLRAVIEDECSARLSKYESD